MSNRQLGWDEQQIRDRLSPREIDDQAKERMEQQEATQTPPNDADRVLDNNPHTHSKQK